MTIAHGAKTMAQILRILTIATSIICVMIFYTPMAISSESTKTTDMVQKIKSSSREELGGLVYHYANKDVHIDDLVVLSSLLENKTPIAAGDDLNNVVYVRDIALVLLQEITGEFFLPSDKAFQVKMVLSFRSDDGLKFFRFEVLSLSDGEFKALKPVIDRWTDASRDSLQ